MTECSECGNPCKGACLGTAILLKEEYMSVDGRALWAGNTIFVFGSNLAGRHGAGAAKYAWAMYSAEHGVGEGPTGRAYALPTKDKKLNPRPLADIEVSVWRFLDYAARHPELEFFVTRIGCGLAGYEDEQVAPFFLLAGSNVTLPDGWWELALGA